MNSQYPTSFSTLIQYMDLSATVWPLKTTSGFGKTGNSVGERRLTSNATLMVDRRDIWCKRLQNGDKLEPNSTKHKPHARRPPKGPRNDVFVPGDLDLWPLTLTFKLVRASDQTRLPCEFGAMRKSVQRFPRYFIHQQKIHRQRQKQNLPQFIACGNDARLAHMPYAQIGSRNMTETA